ncbi:MAG: MaoC family dehydratase [Dehalococcoidales bacterium]|nr:MaoC family dehydratase [Dehalococcoidales bacterium]
MENPKTDFDSLTTGYEFEPATFCIDAAKASAYLDAVEGTKDIYENDGIAPPMTVAALAMTAMGEGLSMPEGAVHVSQDIAFLGKVKLDENLTSRSKVNRIVKRGKFHMLTIGIVVTNANNEPVLHGETSFILPILEQE